MSDSTPEFFSTVPVSVPVVAPDAEDVLMNGFVWSENFGILVGMRTTGRNAILDELYRLRHPMDKLDENEQGLRL